MSHRSRFNIGMGLIREATQASPLTEEMQVMNERITLLEEIIVTMLERAEDGTLQMTAAEIRSLLPE